jgi:hypothetical protein
MLKIKKNNKIIIGAVLLTFAITTLIMYFVNADSGSFTYYQIQANRTQLASTFEQLEETSDIIVRATVLPDKRAINNILPDGSYGFGYTLTNLQVAEVFKGNISEKDVMLITEEYFIRPDEPTVIRTQEGYMPANESAEYIFFLKAYPNDVEEFAGMYFPVDLEYGKYSTSLDESILQSRSKINLDSLEIMSGTTSNERYVDWANQVYTNYMTRRNN